MHQCLGMKADTRVAVRRNTQRQGNELLGLFRQNTVAGGCSRHVIEPFHQVRMVAAQRSQVGGNGTGMLCVVRDAAHN